MSSDFRGGGVLYVLATPIGNLKDITLRALEALKEADYVLSEDTRTIKKLLSAYEISARAVSYHQHSSDEKISALAGLLLEGNKLVLVTEAGTPCISDPGDTLIKKARSLGAPVIPLPGPSAVIAALSVSGFSGHNFYFAGFLPSTGKKLRRKIRDFEFLKTLIIFYDSPFRIKDTLNELFAIMGDKNIFIAREMTKLFEEYRLTSLAAMSADFNMEEKGEFTVIIDNYEKDTDA